MIDVVQGLLVAVVVVLTILLVVIGIQVVNILREIKRSLEKINKILDDAGAISENVSKPLSNVTGVFKMIGLLVDFIKERKKSPSHRFFTKEGKKLA